MPKVYGSYKTGADIYKDRATGRYYIIEWSHSTQKTYKKFVSFKPLSTHESKTIKSSRPGKTRTQTQKKHSKKHIGGESGVLGEMSPSECKTQVLNTESYKTILAQLNLADPTKVFKDIQTIRERYTQNFGGKRLVDVIYKHPAPGKNQLLGQHSALGQYNRCWNHGISNPQSITGGAVGIHVYVADNDGMWQLVGVFIKK
jgi:hypothetical protein